jgi:hypothetical protein
VGRRNAIAEGFDALAAAAKAIHGLRAPVAERARENTLRSVLVELRQIRGKFQSVEESFAAVSRFANEVTTRFKAIEERIEQLSRPQLPVDKGGP